MGIIFFNQSYNNIHMTHISLLFLLSQSVSYLINLEVSGSSLVLDAEQIDNNERWSGEFTAQCTNHDSFSTYVIASHTVFHICNLSNKFSIFSFSVTRY